MNTKTSQERIQKITSKGQMTLPASWRKTINTDTVVVQMAGDTLTIRPARLEKNQEYTVFDAIRDNKGKGLKAKDLSKMLKAM